jgi:hypothetical protein
MVKTIVIVTMALWACASTGFAQTPSGPGGAPSTGGAPSGGAKGNSPPGTPSWGSERMPDRKNPSSPTAPCPAGTSRQNLGQDCKPLDQPEKGKAPKRG